MPMLPHTFVVPNFNEYVVVQKNSGHYVCLLMCSRRLNQFALLRNTSPLFCSTHIFTARGELRKALLAPSVSSLFVYGISREPLNGFAPNSHGRRFWSLARTSLKVNVKGHGHHGQKRHLSALSAACVRFVFGKTSFASSLTLHSHSTKWPNLAKVSNPDFVFDKSQVALLYLISLINTELTDVCAQNKTALCCAKRHAN